MYCGENETSNAAVLLRRELHQHLLEKMTPAAYGDALERFYFTFHCPALSTKYDAHLKVGIYNAKQRAFYSDLYFSDDLAKCRGPINAPTSVETCWRRSTASSKIQQKA